MNLSTFKTNNPAAIMLMVTFSFFIILLFNIDYSPFLTSTENIIGFASIGLSFILAFFISFYLLFSDSYKIDSVETFLSNVDFLDIENFFSLLLFLSATFFFAFLLIIKISLSLF